MRRGIIIIIMLLVGAFALPVWNRTTTPFVDVPDPTLIPTASPTSTAVSLTEMRNEYILHDVPFTSQAPTGKWDDPMYQDGCEEASVLMATRWIEGRSITVSEALQEIQTVSHIAESLFGHYIDTSAKDTAKIMREYNPEVTVRVEENVRVSDMIDALHDESILIVPVNGQVVGNPHFTSPGPLRHMLVVKGYDPETGEFITNDPGTRYGAGFRYATDVLYSAMQDYATGVHKEVFPERKVMVVVKK